MLLSLFEVGIVRRNETVSETERGTLYIRLNCELCGPNGGAVTECEKGCNGYEQRKLQFNCQVWVAFACETVNFELD